MSPAILVAAAIVACTCLAKLVYLIFTESVPPPSESTGENNCHQEVTQAGQEILKKETEIVLLNTKLNRITTQRRQNFPFIDNRTKTSPR